MNQLNFSARWLFAPVAGIIAAGALTLSGGLTSAQTPDSESTPTPTPPSGTETPGTDPSMPGAETAEVTSYDELLAEELDISVDELREARSNAADRYIDELVDAGVLTEEQGDELKEWNPAQAIRDVFNEVNLVEFRDFMMGQIAQVYDMDREQLEQDLRDGKTLKEIAEEQDVSTEDIRNNIQQQVDDMLDMGVQANLITQEQADKLGDFIDRFMNALIDDDDDLMDTDVTPDGEPTPGSTPADDDTPSVPSP